MSTTIGPSPEFLQYPHGLANWRIRQAITDRLRTSTLLFRVTRILRLIGSASVHCSLIFRRGIFTSRLRRSTTRHIQMNTGTVSQILKPNHCRYRAPPITPLCKIIRISQADHQFIPHNGYLLDTITGCCRFSGKSVSRQRWANHMESIFCFASVGHGITQRIDDLKEFYDRPWPTVCQNKGSGLSLFARSMNKMYVQVRNYCLKVFEPIHLTLARRPIVLIRPVFAYVLRITERNALAPIICCFRLRPPSLVQSLL